MKKHVLLVAVLCISGTVYGANLLTNPGFEGSLSGWTQADTGSNWNYNDSAWMPTPSNHSGSGRAGRSLGGGTLTVRHLYQQVTVTPGQRYIIGGYLGGDGLNDGAKTIYFEWVDGAYGGTRTNVRTQEIIDTSGTGIATYFHRFRMVTPTSSTITVVLRGALTGNGGIFVDDMYVRPISDFNDAQGKHFGGPTTITDNMNGTYNQGLPTFQREDQMWSYWRQGWASPTTYSPSEGSGGPGVDPSGKHIRENGTCGLLQNIGGTYRDFITLFAGDWNASVWLNANGNAASGNNFWWEWHATRNTAAQVGSAGLGGDGGGFAKHDGWGSNIGSGWVQCSRTSMCGSGATTSGLLTTVNPGAGDYIRVWSKCGWQASRANPFLADYVQVSTTTPVEDWMVY